MTSHAFSSSLPATKQQVPAEVDVVVVGAGMAGLYLLYRLRAAGLSAVALESADDVGGTWYWNRYPGARCDIQSLDYSFSWDPALDTEWQWSEKYATQPEILRYLQFVADKHDLRRDIRFSTPVAAATWDEAAASWSVRTAHGDTIRARHYVMATGCLSMPKQNDIPGHERFGGEVYVTGRWPREKVDFTGKRVAVIGTGSSAIQAIPCIAREAAELVVFQRTPSFSMPAHNGPIAEAKRARLEADRDAYREAARRSRFGVTLEDATERALQASPQEREARFERAWAKGELFAPAETYLDLGLDLAANALWCDFVRDKIRSIVADPATAEALCPTDYPFGSKRPCLDSGYFETFNLPHVRLVDLRRTPITTVTERGIALADEELEFDAIVYATGFDAMTGALVAVDVAGRDGVTLKKRWEHGPSTYLGLTTVGFPNFFMITGPGSPSVLSNMVVSIEQHVDWIVDCLDMMRARGYTTIEPTPVAEAGWVQHANDCADITFLSQADSWYVGANVPGKPRVVLPYAGGVDGYRATCERVVAADYLGFRLEGPGGTQCHDGVINRLQPDVALLLDAMAQFNLPPFESLSATDARALSRAMETQRPPGPEVGQIVDGVFPGAACELRYRLYRPPSEGPHPVVCYFHGGGWVLGGHDSDDPFCRDLCLRSNTVVISLDYRHAPEARYPAAADDASAALKWVAEHARALGGIPGKLAIAGWSAGGNLAAVACQRARDAGGPDIAGQLLIAPVVDGVEERPSMRENAEGYILTKAVMDWFWQSYADPAERVQPAASPLRAQTLSGLPPAAIFTFEFDVLRDEGEAYAEALERAGNSVFHKRCRGHIHTSPMTVDLLPSSAPLREELAARLRAFFQKT